MGMNDQEGLVGCAGENRLTVLPVQFWILGLVFCPARLGLAACDGALWPTIEADSPTAADWPKDERHLPRLGRSM